MNAPALQGNLSTFSLEDVLKFVEEKAHTGVFEIAQDSGNMLVYFEQGQVICFSGCLDGAKIGRLLFRRSVIGRQDFERLSQVRDADFFKALSEVFARADASMKSVLSECLRLQEKEETVLLFSLKEGNFSFTPQPIECPKPLQCRMPIAQFIQTGRQLSTQWKQVQTILSNPNLYPQIPDLDVIALEECKPAFELWLVLSVLDGRRSVGELAKISPWGRFETLSGLVRFLQKKLVILAENPAPRPAPVALEEQSLPQETGGFLASFRGKEQRSYQPQTKAGVAALMVEGFLESLTSRKDTPLDPATIKSAWDEVLTIFPLADLVSVSPDGADVSRLENLLQIWSDSESACEVVESSAEALKRFAESLFRIASTQIGEKKAQSMYSKVCSGISKRTDLPVSAEQLQALGLDKQA